MAETNWLDLVLGLANVFSPSEAEAKVVAKDPQAQALIDAVRSNAVMPGTREKDPLYSGQFDPIRKNVYRHVLQAAEERPEEVSVMAQKGPLLPADDAAGVYYPDESKIALKVYDPNYSASNRYTDLVPTALNYQQTLAHELLHFLLPKLRQEMRDKVGLMPSVKQYMPKLETRKLYYNSVLDANLLETEGHHQFMEYLFGRSDSPIRRGPTGAWQPDMEAQSKVQSFDDGRDYQFLHPQRDIYKAILQRIIQDPALLEQALQGLQRGAR